MFEQLNSRFARIVKKIKGQGKITNTNIEESLRDIRRALLEADVNYKVAKTFINSVKEKAVGANVFTSVTPGQQFVQILAKEMTVFLGGKNNGITFHKSKKTVILLVGMQGVGKTTTVAKIASFLKNKCDKSPSLLAADLNRPAAIDQLKILGDKIGVSVITPINNNLQATIKKGLSDKNFTDVLIIDSAGRLHIEEDRMQELKDIVEISKPHEILFVADGMTGQDAVNSATIFNKLLELTGIVLTKMDGDARGGAALSIKEVTGKPIKFLGTGENISDIELFNPERLSQRILGMGDVVSLVEKAKEVFDNENVEIVQKKIINNKFTLEDFQIQLSQIKKMGPLSDIFSMIPGLNKFSTESVDDRQLIWTDAIIKSMTSFEKNEPSIINGSRRKRIAKGSGRSIQEVNQLLKQFKNMQIMMKKINKKGKIKFPL